MKRLLRTLALLFFVAGVARAEGEHSPPFCMDWDWTGHKRKLHFWISPGVDDCELDAINSVDPPVGGPNFSLGDAARIAAAIWNTIDVGWEFCETGSQDDACLKIIKLELGPPPAAKPVLPIDGGAGGVGALAIFRQVMHDDMGELTMGEIVYNASIDLSEWGVTPGTMTWDPVIVMLHELGHALRLKDQAGTITPGGAGHIMRGALAKGAHRWNTALGGPDPSNFRNPSTGDLCEANASAEFMDWPAVDCPALPAEALAGLVVTALLVGASLLRAPRP